MNSSTEWTRWCRGAAIVVVAVGLAVGCGETGDAGSRAAVTATVAAAPVQGPVGPPWGGNLVVGDASSACGPAPTAVAKPIDAAKVHFEFCGA